jgi:hypothetical protein
MVIMPFLCFPCLFDVKLLSSVCQALEQELALPIFFTPQEANETLPEIRRIVERIVSIKKDVDSKTDDDAIAKTMELLQREIQRLEDLGCVLKDMSMGLVDFPAVRLGTRVWLCWKLGEANVAFWHGLHEGFAGRKQVNATEFYEDDVAIKSLTSNLVPKAQAQDL